VKSYLIIQAYCDSTPFPEIVSVDGMPRWAPLSFQIDNSQAIFPGLR
jgi:hypothetical protein